MIKSNIYKSIFKKQNPYILHTSSKFFSYQKPNNFKISDEKTKENRNIWFFNIGILSAVFGMVYMLVPLYKKFCQSVGLQGDNHKKTYENIINLNKNNKSRKFKIIFEGEADSELGWDFEPEQRELFVHGGETALMFYKTSNHQTKPIIGTAIYNVYPEYASKYFSKIQCFCFNQQLLNPGEEVMMPLYFYFEPEIEDDPELKKISEIRISYRFFMCKKQDLAILVQKNTIKELENKINILNIRKKNKEIKTIEFNKIEKDILDYNIQLDNIKNL